MVSRQCKHCTFSCATCPSSRPTPCPFVLFFPLCPTPCCISRGFFKSIFFLSTHRFLSASCIAMWVLVRTAFVSARVCAHLSIRTPLAAPTLSRVLCSFRFQCRAVLTWRHVREAGNLPAPYSKSTPGMQTRARRATLEETGTAGVARREDGLGEVGSRRGVGWTRENGGRGRRGKRRQAKVVSGGNSTTAWPRHNAKRCSRHAKEALGNAGSQDSRSGIGTDSEAITGGRGGGKFTPDGALTQTRRGTAENRAEKVTCRSLPGAF